MKYHLSRNYQFVNINRYRVSLALAVGIIVSLTAIFAIYLLQDLLESHATLFRKWMMQMASNYSVLLYGLGSKRQLLEMFRQNYLAGEYDHVTINGYFPGLTVKQIFSCIIGKLM